MGAFAYPKLMEGVRVGVDAAVFLFWLLFVLTEGQILRTAKRAEHFSEKVEYLIILGAQVRGKKITNSLKRRLDRAYEYLKENPKTTVIVSGGRGADESVTEAFAMAEYLKSFGVGEEQIKKEEQSTTTWENLKFSAHLTGGLDRKTAVVTNDFHLYRALRIGKQLGYTKLFGIAATSDPILKLNYMVREFAAVLLTKVKSML